MLTFIKYVEALLGQLLTYGVAGQSAKDQRRIKVINGIALFDILATSFYSTIYLVNAWWLLAGVAYASMVPFILVLVFNHLGWTRFTPFQVLFSALLQLTLVPILFTGPEIGLHYFLFFAGTFAWLTLKPQDRWWAIPILTLNCIGFIWAEWFDRSDWYKSRLDEPMPDIILNTLYLLSTSATSIALLFMVVLFSRELERAQHAFDQEHERARALLLNILPEKIANRLQTGDTTIADQYDHVSVMFADIVGFTKLSATMNANALVERLNRYFSAFDSLVKKHDAEKIKTIGDAYMVAAGVPEPNNNHALTLTALALDMLNTTAEINREYDEPLDLRIGINTGPLVAGVMGKHKFVYDLWGDTVNVAQRMESHGVVGKVHVSDCTFNHICKKYDVAPRGDISVKGKGRERTWLVINHGERGTHRFGPSTPMRPGLMH